LLRKPATGDLLGTEIVTRAPRFVSVAHTWAAEDRGATPDGFTNNVAIGRLTLDSLPGGELRLGPPTDGFGFPLPGQYGLYVDYLQFSPVRVAGNRAWPTSGVHCHRARLTVYGASNLTEEDLDGASRTVTLGQGLHGPASGDVALRDGRTIRVNVGLVDSETIDSDSDGW
jgi:hypothetical protein